MDYQEGRTPREKKIRRAIVFVSSCQTSLGAVLISMSFTVFASSSSDKIRGSCPYWAGFTVLFTGAVGFLTWKQLSIISIGIYTFLSAVSVIVHLVATVLTGDTASFLKSLHSCKVVHFDNACRCCLEETNCKNPYKFPSVRDCSILNGFIKDVMYGLCAANVVCCLICLMVTVMGCTLVAQYSRYSQLFMSAFVGIKAANKLDNPPYIHGYLLQKTYRFHWRQRPRQNIHDHRYNWFSFSTDPIASIPPCAPPIYYPVQNNPRGSGSGYRRPPTVFDPVDFPPPYSSREPSLCGTSQEYHREGYTLASQGSQGTTWDDGSALETEYLGTTEVDQGNSIESLDYVIEDVDERELSTSTGAVLRVDNVIDNGLGLSMRSTLEKEFSEESDAGLYLQLSLGSQDLESRRRASTSSDVFTNASSLEERVNQTETGTSRCNEMLFMRGDDRVGQRRHSCPQNQVYCVHDEVYRSMVAPNVNPWGRRTMSEQETWECYERPSPVRANSITCCTALRKACNAQSITVDEIPGDIAPGDVGEISGDIAPGDVGETSGGISPGDVGEISGGISPGDVGEISGDIAPGDVGGTSGDIVPGALKPGEATSANTSNVAVVGEETGGLFRHFKERKVGKRHKRSKRPRNNPDHILERETGKESSSAGGAVAKENRPIAGFRETVL